MTDITTTEEQAWTTISLPVSVKRKFDEAKAATRLSLSVIADEAIDAFMRDRCINTHNPTPEASHTSRPPARAAGRGS